jgi:hypothetical protein
MPAAELSTVGRAGLSLRASPEREAEMHLCCGEFRGYRVNAVNVTNDDRDDRGHIVHNFGYLHFGKGP